MSIIGRDPSCDIVVPFAGVSARHAHIELCGPGQYRITDLNSSNGTYVNGERIRESVVSLNDDIRLGSHPLNLSQYAVKLEIEHSSEVGYSIGRDPGNDIVIPDSRVSGRHAKVIPERDGLLLIDVGSTNGVFVNDRQVSRSIVRQGDRVRFGSLNVDLLRLVGDMSARCGYRAPAGAVPGAAPVAPRDRIRSDSPARGAGGNGKAERSRRLPPWAVAAIITAAVLVVGAVGVFATGEKVHCNCLVCGTETFDEFAFVWNKDDVHSRARLHRWCPACGSIPKTVQHIKRCKNCGQAYEVIEETRPTREDPRGTDKVLGYCTSCGDEIVYVEFLVRCRVCNKVYERQTKGFPRREEREGGERTEGYCSSTCKFREGLDNFMKGAGKLLGS